MKKQIFHLTTLVAASTFMIAPPAGAQYASAAGPLVQVDERAKSGPNASTVVDDRELALRVQAALSKDKNVAPLSLSVRSTDGKVALSGTATSQSQADRAISIARAVPGVKDVTSEIRVN